MTGTLDRKRDVFINCPFDDDYKPFFQAIVYVVVRAGFVARCALEADNAADNRFDKICRIIRECPYGIHDLSRTQTDGEPPFPRFNMPLELGLFLGAAKFGGRRELQKVCIVFESQRYMYQRYISDIAGQDIHAHDNSIPVLIEHLAAWLRAQSNDRTVPGGKILEAEYNQFSQDIPTICMEMMLNPSEMTFRDYLQIVSGYLFGNK